MVETVAQLFQGKIPVQKFLRNVAIVGNFRLRWPDSCQILRTFPTKKTIKDDLLPWNRFPLQLSIALLYTSAAYSGI